MTEFIEKFRRIEREVAAERGDFVLFALVEREGSGGKWDLVVSASWFGEDKAPALDGLSRKVTSVLDRNELLSLSRIVLLDPTEPFVREMIARATREGSNELRDIDFQGMLLVRAHILALQPDGRLKDEHRPLRGSDRSPSTTGREAAIQP